MEEDEGMLVAVIGDEVCIRIRIDKIRPRILSIIPGIFYDR